MTSVEWPCDSRPLSPGHHRRHVGHRHVWEWHARELGERHRGHRKAGERHLGERHAGKTHPGQSPEPFEEPRASRIEFVDGLPRLVARRLDRPLTEGDELDRARRQRTRPAEATPLDGLELDHRHPVVRRQRHIEHDGRKLGESATGRRRGVVGERRQRRCLRGDLDPLRGFQSHPKFDRVPALKPRGENRIDAHPEPVSGPVDEAERIDGEAVGGFTRCGLHVKRLIGRNPRRKPVAEAVERLLQRRGHEIDERHVERGRLASIGGREPSDEPRRLPIVHRDLDAIAGDRPRLMDAHHLGRFVRVCGGVGVGRERAPRERRSRRRRAAGRDDLHRAAPGLGRAASPLHAKHDRPRLGDERHQRRAGRDGHHQRADDDHRAFHGETGRPAGRADDSGRPRAGPRGFARENLRKTVTRQAASRPRAASSRPADDRRPRPLRPGAAGRRPPSGSGRPHRRGQTGRRAWRTAAAPVLRDAAA